MHRIFLKNHQQNCEKKTRYRFWHMPLFGVGLIFFGGLFAFTINDESRFKLELIVHDSGNLPSTLLVGVPLPLPLLLDRMQEKLDDSDQASAPHNHQTIRVQAGDTLSAIFDRLNIHSQLQEVLANGATKKILQHIRPEESITISLVGHQLQTLAYELDDSKQLYLSRENGVLNAQIQPLHLETHILMAAGSINNSLFGAGKQAGLSDRLIMQLANIFGWDIDFALDIRVGDRFALIYEQHYREGLKIADGDILATEFVNQGKIYRAIRYTNAEGKSNYYDPRGNSMHKPFLRTPVSFSRISSHFNPNRLHPIFKTRMPHRGVDYAAPTSTLVKSSGDGKIIFRGRKRGYGKVVIVQHGGQYTTLYAHLNSYRRGQRTGSRVRQGEVIGYVGQTGWATGPHLHYEFRVNGTHRNPLTVKLPAAKPLDVRFRHDFMQKIAPMLARLDVVNRFNLADLSRDPG